MKVLTTLVLAVIGVIAVSCSLFGQVVSIEIPQGYTGWCYVIPVKDTAELQIKRKGNLFTIDENGVAYIPAGQLDLKRDSKIIVMQNGIDISDQKRYAGSVYKSIHSSGNKYNYIQFYIPAQQERSIKDNQYWRDNSYKYDKAQKLESLVLAGKIIFQ